MKRLILRYFLLLVCFVCNISSWADSYTEDGIIYLLNTSEHTAVVKGVVNKYIAVANIKRRVDGYRVTSIGGLAFKECSSLISVTIPNSVTNIGEEAFSNCTSLTSINIPTSVKKIDNGAFCDCKSLKSINIPNSVTCIGVQVFLRCSSLASIVIPNSVTDIADYAFQDCSSLTSVTIPNLVRNIGSGAFYKCYSLTSVTIPNLVRNIGQGAFSKCYSLTSVTIPNLVRNIEREAFSDCHSLQCISFERCERPNLGYNAFYRIASDPIAIVPQGSKDSYEYGDFRDFLIYEKGEAKIKMDELIASASEEVKENSLLYSMINVEDRTAYENQLTNAQQTSANSIDEFELVKAYLNFKKEYNNMHYAILYMKGNKLFMSLLDLYTEANKFFPDYSPLTMYPYAEKDGLITDASQLSTNIQELTDGSLETLIDNDIQTSFHSIWNNKGPIDGYQFLQIDLRDAYKQIALKYTKCQCADGIAGCPKTLRIYVTNTPDDANSWTDLGTKTCTYEYENSQTGLLPIDFGGKSYRYVRLTEEDTLVDGKTNGNLFCWSELHAYTRASKADMLSEATFTALTTAITQAKDELYDEWATKDTYNALQSAYDVASNELDSEPILIDFAPNPYLTAYSDKALTVPAGVRVGVVIANGEGIRNDYRYNSGDIIPAETSVLLKGGRGNSFYLTSAETNETAPEDNLLHGTLNDETTYVEGAGKYYKLSYDKATGTEIGFYWGATDGGAFTNKAGKAFLAIPTTMSAAQLAGFSLFDLENKGAITGIDNAHASSVAATFKAYDLNGRRINAQSADELSKGIYIINGKKVIIK